MMLTTKLEAEEPKCNLEVLYDMSHLGESYAPSSLVEDNLVVPDAGLQRVESYVNSLIEPRARFNMYMEST